MASVHTRPRTRLGTAGGRGTGSTEPRRHAPPRPAPPVHTSKCQPADRKQELPAQEPATLRHQRGRRLHGEAGGKARGKVQEEAPTWGRPRLLKSNSEVTMKKLQSQFPGGFSEPPETSEREVCSADADSWRLQGPGDEPGPARPLAGSLRPRSSAVAPWPRGSPSLAPPRQRLRTVSNLNQFSMLQHFFFFLTTCPLGAPHTHRFSGSELKGSALINKRLMTDPPGKEPDIPARTSVRETTEGTWRREPSWETRASLGRADATLRTRHGEVSKATRKRTQMCTINGLGLKITIRGTKINIEW